MTSNWWGRKSSKIGSPCFSCYLLLLSVVAVAPSVAATLPPRCLSLPSPSHFRCAVAVAVAPPFSIAVIAVALPLCHLLLSRSRINCAFYCICCSAFHRRCRHSCRCCAIHCRCRRCSRVTVTPFIAAAITPTITAVAVAVAVTPSIAVVIIAVASPLRLPSPLPLPSRCHCAFHQRHC